MEMYFPIKRIQVTIVLLYKEGHKMLTLPIHTKSKMKKAE